MLLRGGSRAVARTPLRGSEFDAVVVLDGSRARLMQWSVLLAALTSWTRCSCVGRPGLWSMNLAPHSGVSCASRARTFRGIASQSPIRLRCHPRRHFPLEWHIVHKADEDLFILIHALSKKLLQQVLED